MRKQANNSALVAESHVSAAVIPPRTERTCRTTHPTNTHPTNTHPTNTCHVPKHASLTRAMSPNTLHPQTRSKPVYPALSPFPPVCGVSVCVLSPGVPSLCPVLLCCPPVSCPLSCPPVSVSRPPCRAPCVRAPCALSPCVRAPCVCPGVCARCVICIGKGGWRFRGVVYWCSQVCLAK